MNEKMTCRKLAIKYLNKEVMPSSIVWEGQEYPFTGVDSIDMLYGTDKIGYINLVSWIRIDDEIIAKYDVLDEVEKEYLKNVLKPFYKKVESICKNGGDDYEWIDIYFRNDGLMSFPCFEKGKMYAGMQSRKRYTLKELNIDFGDDKND